MLKKLSLEIKAEEKAILVEYFTKMKLEHETTGRIISIGREKALPL